MNDILLFPVITITKDELGQVEEDEVFSRQVFCKKNQFLNQNSFKLDKVISRLVIY